jgi:hypothetical protein
MPFRCGALGREASAGDARLLRVALEFLDDKLFQLFIAELRHWSLVRRALWRPVDVLRDVGLFPENMTVMSAAKWWLGPGSYHDYRRRRTTPTSEPVAIRVQFAA